MSTLVYVIKDTGPAGGIVFYDKGSYSDGWRYLEAASANQTNQGDGIEWGPTTIATMAWEAGVGHGKANTETIITVLGENNGTIYPAKVCYDLVLGGYDDWFLPSRDELNLMYENLHNQATPLGSFGSAIYCSSTEYPNSPDNLSKSKMGVQYFNDGNKAYFTKTTYCYTRAIRSF